MGIDMRKAWIVDGVIKDIAHSEPTEIYHPDVAVFYDTEVPDDAENGDGWVDGVLVKPEPPVIEAPTEPEETPTE
jgi:hypothetical protein